jgi:apolipoprotein N-acyltransferase
VLQRSGVYTPALLVADVPLRDALTISDRLGAWPERVVAALGLLAVLLALPRRRRPDRSRASAEPSAPAVLASHP